jgi:soluble lytic murein transglycosylase
VQRLPQTYFGERAAERLQHANGDPDLPSVVSLIPPVVPLPSLDGPLPAAADVSWTRAQALESIAFDNSAELELRDAYAATHAPQVLFAAAQAAVAAGHYAAGITAVRQIAPQLEARRLSDLPDEVWRAAFPLPYRDALERESLRNRLDPMLVAGLIRQESAFASDAVSRSDALGLMQLLPPTGAEMARVVRVRFSRAQLFDPEYNVRLGTLYFANLLASLGTPEAALAAYNAGADRVASWTRGQNYEETPEFVESIPFSETRDYVQIVLRNADLYRRIYGAAGAPKPAVAQAQ